MLNYFRKNVPFKTFISYPLTIIRRSNTTMTPASTKLNELRQMMEKHNLAAYYIPSEDSHQVNRSLNNITI